MPEDSNLITRFAPSPTGYLHIGGARTALFCWLLGHHTGGKYLLRIEDTDLARSTTEATRQLVEDLKWLRLQWDNPELVYQSKRVDLYNRIIEKLLAEGKAYKDWETKEELDAKRAEAEKRKRSFVYKRPQLTPEQIKQFESEGRPHVVRFAMPLKDYSFDDAVLGPNQGVKADQVQDFVIRKSDGMPTYHFAVVVDDFDMKITHVVRGQEHLLNSVNHIALQEALGYPRPIFVHLPVILNPETSEKLSKRDRDRKIRQRCFEWFKSQKKTAAELSQASGLSSDRLDSWLKDDKKQLDLTEQPRVMNVIGLKETDLPEIMVHDFRRNGYLPEAMNNFLALLGWNPGENREHMTMDEMAKLFVLSDIGRSNAKFNREKLVSFNKDHAQRLLNENPKRLVEAMREYLTTHPESPVNKADDATLLKLLQMKAGFRLLREVDEQARFLFVDDNEIKLDPAAVEKVLKKNDGFTILRELHEVLATIGSDNVGSAPRTDTPPGAGNDSVREADPTWTAANIEAAVNQFATERNLKLNQVAQPLRVAITGTTVSPPIFQSLEMLGKIATIARIDRTVQQN